jgi:sodium-dependent dicarboxylate transporter 2/3/5
VSVKKIALWLGPIAFSLILMFPISSIDVLSWRVLAVAVWMLIWWLSETVNLAVTALLPLILFPLLNILPIADVSANYANPLVYLFFGGFLLALGIEKWGLHRRIALFIIRITGTSTLRVFLGFMISTAFLSMWISNTATTVMMLPIALSVIELVETKKKSRFAVLLLIGLAWSANIGGIATLIGTPPNLVLAGFMKEELNREIFFSDWIVFGFPVSITLLTLGYFLLISYLPKDERQADSVEVKKLIRAEADKLGKLKGAELRVLVVFVLTALAWIVRKQVVDLTGWTALSDTTIALCAGFVLFVLPANEQRNKRLLTWKDTEKLGWGILLLFGGGLALAAAIQKSTWVLKIGDAIGSMHITSIILMVLIITLIGIFLTEVVSNLALVTALLPLVAAVAVGANTDFFNLALPLTIGASCAFMLPMATPPNAIVFSSKRITVAQMARYGFLMNLLATLVIVLAVWLMF